MNFQYSFLIFLTLMTIILTLFFARLYSVVLSKMHKIDRILKTFNGELESALGEFNELNDQIREIQLLRESMIQND